MVRKLNLDDPVFNLFRLTRSGCVRCFNVVFSKNQYFDQVFTIYLDNPFLKQFLLAFLQNPAKAKASNEVCVATVIFYFCGFLFFATLLY